MAYLEPPPPPPSRPLRAFRPCPHARRRFLAQRGAIRFLWGLPRREFLCERRLLGKGRERRPRHVEGAAVPLERPSLELERERPGGGVRRRGWGGGGGQSVTSGKKRNGACDMSFLIFNLPFCVYTPARVSRSPTREPRDSARAPGDSARIADYLRGNSHSPTPRSVMTRLQASAVRHPLWAFQREPPQRRCSAHSSCSRRSSRCSRTPISMCSSPSCSPCHH